MTIVIYDFPLSHTRFVSSFSYNYQNLLQVILPIMTLLIILF